MILGLAKRRYYNMTVKTIINDDPSEYDFDEIKEYMIE